MLAQKRREFGWDGKHRSGSPPSNLLVIVYAIHHKEAAARVRFPDTPARPDLKGSSPDFPLHSRAARS